MGMRKLINQKCIQMQMLTFLIATNLQVSMAQMSFDALIIHNTSATWSAGPTNFTITHCTKVSVVIMGGTSECCASASVTGSSCSECTNNIKGCFVEAETFEYGFAGGKESSCFNRTDVALRCLVCQPGYCSPTEPPMISMSTERQTPATQTLDNVPSNLSTTSSVVNATQPTTSTGTTPFHSTEKIPGTSATPTGATRNSSETPTTTTDVYNSTDSALNETSTEPFDLEQSKKDLYTFLGALGASLLLVFIIVCAFFIRKNRSKKPIVNISDEFWSSKDYITDIDDDAGNFCVPGASYSVINPAYKNQTYRDPSNYCNSLESASPKYVKTETFRPSYTSHAPQVNDDFRLERLEPAARASSPIERSTDDEAGVVMDLTKIVASEIKSQQQQRARKIEDRKIITEPASGNGQYRKGKRSRDSRQQSRSGKRTAEEVARKRGQRSSAEQHSDEADMYAVSYKSRLQDYLDQCSAEESDV